ncbi:MAG: hypothetical protein ACE5IF_02065, partial [Candidatus Bathyarchaeia archaeon]
AVPVIPDCGMKKLQFVKIKCQCGHSNLAPVYEVFHVYEPIRYEKCRRMITRYVRMNSIQV